jgi:hypothetical protein
VTVEHDLIAGAIEPHRIGARTRSAALLAWFLETVWRIDPEVVEDSICDGGGDKGIDGIVVSPDLGEIAIFQSKYRETDKTTQGDADLKFFYGVAPYFTDRDGVDRLLASAPNEELRKLINRLDLRELLAAGGFECRLVFVTNAPADAAARDYLATLDGRQPPLELWDRDRLAAIADRTRHPGLLDADVQFRADSTVVQEMLDGGVTMAVALVPAQQLVALPGIGDLTIFDLNVRLSLGNTRINRDLAKTVRAVEEHPLFPAYHNGLTLLTNKLTVDDEILTLNGVSVVNGCQSLVTLYNNQIVLTPDLRVLVKVVEIAGNLGLESVITYRANNQNPVNIRDQRSTHALQLDLQTQVREAYGGRMFYAIREGEQPDAPEVLDNRLAAQMITAIWLRQPWAAVRKVRLFDEDYYRVFSRVIDAHKLRLIHVFDELISVRRAALSPELQSSFASVRFTLAYLVAQVVRQSPLGEEAFNETHRWLPELEAEFRDELGPIVDSVIDSVNLHIETREEEATEERPFDPKVVFKSAAGVRDLENQVIQADRFVARRAERLGERYGFAVEPVR